MRNIIIDGRVYEWKTIRELRRAQINEARRQNQLQLFELVNDSRPTTQRSADGRYSQPLLFKVD
jgi:hypothetical protein